MSNFRQHEEVTTFLKQVCREIKAKEVHAEVRLELESHLQELIEEKLGAGIDLDAAVKESIAQMGTPDVIGQQFHQAHRPRFNWGLLVIVVLLMSLGLVAIFSVQAALSNTIGQKQIVYLCIGSCLMLMIGFNNYSKLARYSWGLYVATIMLLSYVLLTGNNTMNGIGGYVRVGGFQINIPAISPYFLLIALAGIWSTPPRIVANESFLRAFARRSWINVGTIWLPSFFILKTHSIANFVLFFMGSMTLLLVLKMKRTILVAHCSLLIATVGWFLYSLYKIKRLLAFLNPNDDQQGMNYLLAQSKIAMHSAGWWGHGFGAPFNTLPVLQSEMMFPFLIYCFGWGAGIAIVIVVSLFVQQMLGISRKVRDPYGKALVSCLLTMLATQYVWSMLMSMGLAPYSTFQLPFISFNGTLVIFHFIAIGLMLSVYRRKDLGTWQFT